VNDDSYKAVADDFYRLGKAGTRTVTDVSKITSVKDIAESGWLFTVMGIMGVATEETLTENGLLISNVEILDANASEGGAILIPCYADKVPISTINSKCLYTSDKGNISVPPSGVPVYLVKALKEGIASVGEKLTGKVSRSNVLELIEDLVKNMSFHRSGTTAGTLKYWNGRVDEKVIDIFEHSYTGSDPINAGSAITRKAGLDLMRRQLSYTTSGSLYQVLSSFYTAYFMKFSSVYPMKALVNRDKSDVIKAGNALINYDSSMLVAPDSFVPLDLWMVNNFIPTYRPDKENFIFIVRDKMVRELIDKNLPPFIYDYRKDAVSELGGIVELKDMENIFADNYVESFNKDYQVIEINIDRTLLSAIYDQRKEGEDPSYIYRKDIKGGIVELKILIENMFNNMFNGIYDSLYESKSVTAELSVGGVTDAKFLGEFMPYYLGYYKKSELKGKTAVAVTSAMLISFYEWKQRFGDEFYKIGIDGLKTDIEKMSTFYPVSGSTKDTGTSQDGGYSVGEVEDESLKDSIRSFFLAGGGSEGISMVVDDENAYKSSDLWKLMKLGKEFSFKRDTVFVIYLKYLRKAEGKGINPRDSNAGLPSKHGLLSDKIIAFALTYGKNNGFVESRYVTVQTVYVAEYKLLKDFKKTLKKMDQIASVNTLPEYKLFKAGMDKMTLDESSEITYRLIARDYTFGLSRNLADMDVLIYGPLLDIEFQIGSKRSFKRFKDWTQQKVPKRKNVADTVKNWPSWDIKGTLTVKNVWKDIGEIAHRGYTALYDAISVAISDSVLSVPDVHSGLRAARSYSLADADLKESNKSGFKQRLDWFNEWYDVIDQTGSGSGGTYNTSNLLSKLSAAVKPNEFKKAAARMLPFVRTELGLTVADSLSYVKSENSIAFDSSLLSNFSALAERALAASSSVLGDVLFKVSDDSDDISSQFSLSFYREGSTGTIIDWGRKVLETHNNPNDFEIQIKVPGTALIGTQFGSIDIVSTEETLELERTKRLLPFVAIAFFVYRTIYGMETPFNLLEWLAEQNLISKSKVQVWSDKIVNVMIEYKDVGVGNPQVFNVREQLHGLLVLEQAFSNIEVRQDSKSGFDAGLSLLRNMIKNIKKILDDDTFLLKGIFDYRSIEAYIPVTPVLEEGVMIRNFSVKSDKKRLRNKDIWGYVPSLVTMGSTNIDIPTVYKGSIQTRVGVLTSGSKGRLAFDTVKDLSTLSAVLFYYYFASVAFRAEVLGGNLTDVKQSAKRINVEHYEKQLLNAESIEEWNEIKNAQASYEAMVKKTESKAGAHIFDDYSVKEMWVSLLKFMNAAAPFNGSAGFITEKSMDKYVVYEAVDGSSVWTFRISLNDMAEDITVDLCDSAAVKKNVYGNNMGYNRDSLNNRIAQLTADPDPGVDSRALEGYDFNDIKFIEVFISGMGSILRKADYAMASDKVTIYEDLSKYIIANSDSIGKPMLIEILDGKGALTDELPDILVYYDTNGNAGLIEKLNSKAPKEIIVRMPIPIIRQSWRV